MSLPPHIRLSLARAARNALLTAAAALLPAVATAQNGTFTGTITNAATSAPVPNVSVTACRSDMSCLTSATSASGEYHMSIAAGTYFLYTSNAGTLVDEIHDNIQCPGACSINAAISLGTATVLPAGGMVTRDFQLSPGGSISGTVRNTATSAGLPGVVVNVYTRYFNSNLFVGNAVTNASGAYTVSGLGTATYFANTSSAGAVAPGYTNEIYDNILCMGSCSTTTTVASGTEIAVTIGADTPGKNFGLDVGGTLTGTVTNSATSTPLTPVNVQVYTRIGTNVMFVASGNTNVAGVFTIAGLPTGTYFAYAQNNLGFINEAYGNVICAVGCTTGIIATGTPINVTLGATTSGVDFPLDLGGSISGTITNEATATGLQNVSVAVCVQGPPTSCSTGFGLPSNAAGQYAIGGLPSGTYNIYSINFQGFVDEIFDNIPCFGPCTTPNAVAGSAIVVTAGATTAGGNFALAAGGAISGTVTHAVTAAALSGVTVSVYRNVGGAAVFANSASTNATGLYTVRNLPTGTYYAFTSAGTQLRLVNEIHNNIPCAGNSCSTNTAVSSGTPIAVNAPAAAGIDFALGPRADAPSAPGNFGAVISNYTVQFSWTAPTAGAEATSYLLEAGLSPGATAITFPVGGTSFSAPGVPPGRYYARVKGVNAFGTGPASSEFVVIVNGNGSGGLSPPTNLVVFMSGGRLTMTWTAPVFGGVPAGYRLEAGSATKLSNIASVTLTTRSFTFDPVPPGFFFLRVRTRSGPYVSDPSVEMMINVGGVPAPPSAPQSFSHSVSGSTVTFTWQAPLSGTATGYVLEAGSESGLANIVAGAPVGNVLTISFPGVPPGTYYVRIRAVNAQGASVVSNERTVIVS
jgi:5-hydroxyisourate hydrolase-like protein (transthyretin family)